MIQIEWNASSFEEARKVITLLLENKLIACANLIPAIESHYWWKEKIETSSEIKVYLKTIQDHFQIIEQVIRQNCSYGVPEIVALEILEVSTPYKNWALSVLRQ